MNQRCLTALSSLFLLKTACGFVTDSRNLIRGEIAVQVKTDTSGASMESSENRSRRRDFLATATLSLGSIFFPSLPAFADGDDSSTTLHILNYPIDGKCGEAQVPEAGVFFAKTFGKLEDGSCAAEGYTVDEGTANGTGEKDSKRTYSIYSK